MKDSSTIVAADETHLEIELDPQTYAEVEKLASESGVTPFEMCVTLLSERLASSGGQSLPG